MKIFLLIISISIVIIYFFYTCDSIESFNNIYLNQNLSKKYPFNTNIYKLAPMQATSLGAYPLYEKEAMVKMNNYPNNMKQRPWCANWSNQSNRFYCFIDKHLNRKCWWAC